MKIKWFGPWERASYRDWLLQRYKSQLCAWRGTVSDSDLPGLEQFEPTRWREPHVCSLSPYQLEFNNPSWERPNIQPCLFTRAQFDFHFEFEWAFHGLRSVGHRPVRDGENLLVVIGSSSSTSKTCTGWRNYHQILAFQTQPSRYLSHLIYSE